MAASYTCDGCGCNVAHPKQVGHVIKRDYCDSCKPKAEAYLEAEELLRMTAQKQFVGARNALIATSALSNFKLPDVP